MNPKMNVRILLTAFRDTSAELLLKNISNYRTLLLPNDKVRDSEILIDAISRETFDYVISVGQRPNMKDKVHIETTARTDGYCISTDFECERLVRLLCEKGIAAKLSHSAGSSYCNQLYLNGLRHIIQEKQHTRMVFIHIPFLRNIVDFDWFSKQFRDVIEAFRESSEEGHS